MVNGVSHGFAKPPKNPVHKRGGKLPLEGLYSWSTEIVVDMVTYRASPMHDIPEYRFARSIDATTRIKANMTKNLVGFLVDRRFNPKSKLSSSK